MEVRAIQTLDVEVVAGADRGKRARVERPLFRIGSHPSNDLVLRDDTVSERHLEIAVVPEGFRLLDLSSSNGTFIGRLRVVDAVIVEPVTLTLGKSTLYLEPTALETEVPSSVRTQFGRVLGRSSVMRELFEELAQVAESDCAVLLEGETGVGKELVAESIHHESARKEGPFVIVDCGALAGELVESELFGHEKGAFTGADTERQGLLEAAHGGTLFLDEVGELPLGLQVKLLGALERKQVRRVGGNRLRPLDVRVIAATNRNLAREVNAGKFRADLFYRLAVVLLRVPPLRERLEDLPLLGASMLAELRQRYGDAMPAELSALVLARLAAQPWPGNVRELKNAIERVALRAADARSTGTSDTLSYVEIRDRFMADFDHRYLTSALERCNFNVTRAAELVGLRRSYFQRLLAKHGISPRALRPR
jgi:DNA-binding NtrC family response regulator